MKNIFPQSTIWTNGNLEEGGNNINNVLLKPPLVGATVKAIYSKPELERWEGNPLIEALPALLCEDDAIQYMEYYPEYDPSYRDEPESIRLHRISTVFEYRCVLRPYRELERIVSKTLRTGYVSRNPLHKTYVKNIDDRVKHFLKQLKVKPKYELDNRPKVVTNGFALIGMSGLGKTQGLARALSPLPQVIKHCKYKKSELTMDQLVWLHLNCPHQGSTKSLCLKFFEMVDCVLETSYSKTHAKASYSEDVLVENMARIALLQGLGLLIIDEIQNLSVAKSGGADEMINFLVCLVNTIGLPVILIGTPEADNILNSKFQQIRRSSGENSEPWLPMIKGPEWDYFFEGLWPYQYTKEAVPLTQELKDTFLEQSQGIADFAVKLFAASQTRAIESKVEKITPSIVKSASKDFFARARANLNAQKVSNYRELGPDVNIRPAEFLQSPPKELTSHQDSKYSAEIDQKVLEIANDLMKNGFAYSVAFTAAKEAVDILGHEESSQALYKLSTNFASKNLTSEPGKRTSSKKSKVKDVDMMPLDSLNNSSNDESNSLADNA